MAIVSDFWLREAGLEVLAHPGAVESSAYHAITEPFHIAPHHHERSIQIDVIAGCKGRLFIDDQWLGFESDIGHIAYPSQTHGYSLEKRTKDAVVYHFKLMLDPEIEFVKEQVLPRASELGEKVSQIVSIAENARQSWGDPSSPRVSAAIQLLQILSAWPTSRNALGAVSTLDVDDHVEVAASMIEGALDDPPSLDELASASGISGRHLTRLFVASTGMTPARYATVRRLDRAKVLLISRRTPIADVADELGFASLATFTRWFRMNEGRTPTEFRDSPTVF